ncbi:unnamed protein product [Lepeophtheirus salmonis]|uniref:(salmon louse) hypothetical protein n=1 Tax=Lepeophtheirus salmonis TaxID=72036 RepID=A0A7R8CVE2_LEPSM|nr:unnamed protein product [Lepeophtheirus salmonis]CAF2943062.1 unnamed protein product [Lepeophtheirus salmonis]
MIDFASACWDGHTLLTLLESPHHLYTDSYTLSQSVVHTLWDEEKGKKRLESCHSYTDLDHAAHRWKEFLSHNTQTKGGRRHKTDIKISDGLKAEHQLPPQLYPHRSTTIILNSICHFTPFLGSAAVERRSFLFTKCSSNCFADGAYYALLKSPDSRIIGFALRQDIFLERFDVGIFTQSKDKYRPLGDLPGLGFYFSLPNLQEDLIYSGTRKESNDIPADWMFCLTYHSYLVYNVHVASKADTPFNVMVFYMDWQ